MLDALDDRGWQPQVIECARLAEPDVSMTVTTVGGHTSVRLCDDGRQTDAMISPGTRVLRRQPEPPPLPFGDDVDAGIRQFVSAQYRIAMMTLFTVGAIWMNDVSHERLLDQNKTLGNAIGRRVGLTTIPTVLTDSTKEWQKYVREFGRVGDIAVKPVAAWAANVVGSDIPVGIYTARLTVEEALELTEYVATAPVLLQPYIEKDHELRITVVGDRVFSCRIDSQASAQTATDWRHYDFDHVTHAASECADGLRDQILRFMDVSGLVYGAFDFIVTPSGESVFVEVNPAGQFGWIEELCGLPISNAIADWLLLGDLA